MPEISKEENTIMSEAEDIVCKYFGITLSQLVSKDLTNDTVMARNCLFYILHGDFKISISKIASSYFRQERSVKAQMAKMRVCMKSNKVYKNIHSDLMCLMCKIKSGTL